MTELSLLAAELGSSERTLRRAGNRDAIRMRIDGPRRRRLEPGGLAYLRTHWRRVAALTESLRTLPSVRLAVLYGSTARGDDTDTSDVDVLVRFRKDGVRP